MMFSGAKAERMTGKVFTRALAAIVMTLVLNGCGLVELTTQKGEDEKRIADGASFQTVKGPQAPSRPLAQNDYLDLDTIEVKHEQDARLALSLSKQAWKRGDFYRARKGLAAIERFCWDDMKRLIQGELLQKWSGDSLDLLDFLRSVYELWVESEPRAEQQRVAYENLIRVETFARIYADCKRLGANPYDEIRRQYDSVARNVEDRLLRLERLKKAVYESEADEAKQADLPKTSALLSKPGGLEKGEVNTKTEPPQPKPAAPPDLRISKTAPPFSQRKDPDQSTQARPRPERPPLNPVFMTGSLLPDESGPGSDSRPKSRIEQDEAPSPSGRGGMADMTPDRRQVAETPVRKRPQPEPASADQILMVGDPVDQRFMWIPAAQPASTNIPPETAHPQAAVTSRTNAAAADSARQGDGLR